MGTTKLTTDGQLWIGSTAAPHVVVGNIASSNSSITVTNASGSINLAIAGTITQYNALVGGASNAIASVAPSSTSGVPLISQGSSANPTFGTAVVAGGGTGIVSTVAYAVLCGGISSTGALQSVASVGTAGQVLTSAGAGALPTFSDPAAGGIPTIGSSTDKSVVTWNGTSGNAVQSNSGWTISSATGQMIGSVGSAGNPTYSFVAKTGYGMYQSSNQINFAAAGSAYLSLDQNGVATFSGFVTLNSGMRFAYTSSATNLTFSNTATIGAVTNTSSARTVTLPSSGSNLAAGSIFFIKDESGAAGTNNITVSVNGGVKTIDGSTSYVINTNYGSLRVYYNGTNYFII